MARGLTKTISAKKIIGKIWDVIPKDANGEYLEGVQVPLFEIRGEVTGLEKTISVYGENWGLLGNFEAFSNITGEILVGVKAFIPEVATSMVKAAFDNAGGDVSVLFAFAIGVKYASSAKGPGYEYTVHELMENKAIVNRLADVTVPFSGKVLGADLSANVTPMAQVAGPAETEEQVRSEPAEKSKAAKKA